ncbi:hypothetical protein [Actinosynnema pretiosum]|uniref:Uncharacterized protein n=1 Tax=Actinosynnema pretiosum TaxID=42197 RepID=A0A290ZDZ0_9PSEU|nr:hypothetical protein [Actinosynnema pretiosum]ATE57260.1 hypothetical protein CNX65_31475 [Actinosynnema pretiosum]
MTRFEVSARRVADRDAGVLRAVLPRLCRPALVVVAAGLGVVARLGASEVDRGLPREVPRTHAAAVWLIGLTAVALWLSAAAHPAWQADGWDLAGRGGTG